MKRSDVRRLQAVREYPSITITLPTNRTSPDNQQDPIRLKNLVSEAINRLQGESSKRDVANVVERLQSLADEYDPERGMDGLALFVNSTVQEAYVLPFSPPERVAIDETFLTRDLVFTLNRSPRYRALLLSEQGTRLFEGIRENLHEVRDGKFPFDLGGPGGASKLPGGHGVNPSARRDASHEHYFQEIDQEVADISKDDRLPLVVVGVERYLSHYNEVTQLGDDIIATVNGNYDHFEAPQVGELAWPAVEEGMAKLREGALDQLDAAIGAKKFASSIGQIWQAANEGRGELLLVEQGYYQAARVSVDGTSLTLVDDPTPPDVLDDAVDEIIEMVISKGGRVRFVDDGALEAHERIVLTTRY